MPLWSWSPPRNQICPLIPRSAFEIFGHHRAHLNGRVMVDGAQILGIAELALSCRAARLRARHGVEVPASYSPLQQTPPPEPPNGSAIGDAVGAVPMISL